MDISSALLGIGLLLAFIAPVGYVIIDQSRRGKARKNALFTAASRLNLVVSQFEILNSLNLALDEPHKKLLAITSEKKNEPKVIDLNNSQVQMILKYDDDAPTPSVDNIRKILLHVKGGGSEQHLCFFSSGTDPVTEVEMRLQKAREWKEVLAKF